SGRRQLADEPVGLRRVGEPGLGPAMLDAGLDRLGVDALTVAVEERQLAAGLAEAVHQPRALRRGRHQQRRCDFLERLRHGLRPFALILRCYWRFAKSAPRARPAQADRLHCGVASAPAGCKGMTTMTAGRDGRVSAQSAKLTMAFSNVGHFFTHFLMLIYATVVLVLDGTFALSYGELLSLSLPGFILYGAAALPAGWLGDRWSA